MTGYTVHTGSTEKFSEGWDKIFSAGKKNAAKKSTESASQPAPAKKKNATPKKSGKKTGKPGQ